MYTLSRSSRTAFTEAVVCTKWVVTEAPTQHRQEAAHLSAAYTFSRTGKAQRAQRAHHYAQTSVNGQPEGCKLLRREATQRVLTHKLQLLAQM